MISFKTGGSTAKTDRFLEKMMRGDLYSNLERFAQQGVDALSAATPIYSGVTAQSWEYEIVKSGGAYTIWWKNTNVENGFHVAIGLQYGHGTGGGGYFQGYDYINPALKPVFDKIATDVWKEVQNA